MSLNENSDIFKERSKNRFNKFMKYFNVIAILLMLSFVIHANFVSFMPQWAIIGISVFAGLMLFSVFVFLLWSFIKRFIFRIL